MEIQSNRILPQPSNQSINNSYQKDSSYQVRVIDLSDNDNNTSRQLKHNNSSALDLTSRIFSQNAILDQQKPSQQEDQEIKQFKQEDFPDFVQDAFHHIKRFYNYVKCWEQLIIIVLSFSIVGVLIQIVEENNSQIFTQFIGTMHLFSWFLACKNGLQAVQSQKFDSLSYCVKLTKISIVIGFLSIFIGVYYSLIASPPSNSQEPSDTSNTNNSNDLPEVEVQQAGISKNFRNLATNCEEGFYKLGGECVECYKVEDLSGQCFTECPLDYEPESSTSFNCVRAGGFNTIFIIFLVVAGLTIAGLVYMMIKFMFQKNQSPQQQNQIPPLRIDDENNRETSNIQNQTLGIQNQDNEEIEGKPAAEEPLENDNNNIENEAEQEENLQQQQQNEDHIVEIEGQSQEQNNENQQEQQGEEQSVVEIELEQSVVDVEKSNTDLLSKAQSRKQLRNNRSQKVISPDAQEKDQDLQENEQEQEVQEKEKEKEQDIQENDQDNNENVVESVDNI